MSVKNNVEMVRHNLYTGEQMSFLTCDVRQEAERVRIRRSIEHGKRESLK
jgi:hypothetical protein